MTTHSFNAQEELENVRKQKLIAKRKKYVRSRLQQWHKELIEMREAGASYPELALWLRQKKHIKVAHSTVLRYLKKLNPNQLEKSHDKVSQCKETG